MKNKIDFENTDNLGGVNTLKFIPVAGVASIAPVLGGAIHTGVVLNDNYAWYELPFTLETMGFKDEGQPSENGTFYNKQIVGIVPKHNAEKINFLSNTDNVKFIVDCLDNNGIRRLVGTVAEPLILIVSADTKTSVAGRNEYLLTFTGSGTALSPVYNI